MLIDFINRSSKDIDTDNTFVELDYVHLTI